MKRMLILCLALLLLLPALPCAGAETPSETPLPQEIAAFFTGKSFENAQILSRASLSGFGSDDRFFVVIRGKSNDNILYAFKQKNGAWTEDFHTSSAVWQTGHGIRIEVSESGREWTGESYSRPHLYIGQENDTGEYWELTAVFELQKGKWMLHRIAGYTGYDSMLIRDGKISYYRDRESDQIAGTAEGTFQRDLRYVSLDAIPKTLAEARRKLTVAPGLPASTELTVVPVTFTDNQKWDVYSAPDKASLRGANGKARVSTNSWIQVFGTDGDWVLIQYSIDASHYRFGYISSTSLPKKASVPALQFHQTPVWLRAETEMTDDPLYSRDALLTLPEGTPCTWLASFGDWAYIELNLNDLARGFVPLSAITADRVFDMRSQPADSGVPVYEGTITVTHDDRLEAAITVFPDGPLAGQTISRILVTDTPSASPLASLLRDEGGTWFGNCGLGGDVVSVTLTALDESGNPLSPAVRVEW